MKELVRGSTTTIPNSVAEKRLLCSGLEGMGAGVITGTF